MTSTMKPEDTTLARDKFQSAREPDISEFKLFGHNHRRPPFLLWGICLVSIGFSSYLLGVLLGIPRVLLGLDYWMHDLNQAIVWYSGVPIVAGISLALVDIKIFLKQRRFFEPVQFSQSTSRNITVALTAYNDETSIASSVKDFLDHPDVLRVIVVSNNSTDRTYENAKEAGAIVFNEKNIGYGRCVFRCLTEAEKYGDVELVLLCEGDMTFRAFDIDKFLAYASHADIVNGTRTSEPLRQRHTQLSTFIYYGNLFVGKLLEAKHLGRCTLTDVGTTYKLCHRNMLPRLLSEVNPDINLEFNAHFVDMAISTGHTVVECPITFHARIGESKGGNINDMRGLLVGLRMMKGIILGWKTRNEK